MPFAPSVNDSKNQIQGRLLSSAGVLATGTYSFTTALKSGSETEMKGWCLGSTPLTAGQLPLVSGKGILINNKRDTSVYFRVSGQVKILPAYTCPYQWSVWGNGTPVPVDFKDVKVYDKNGVLFAPGTNDSKNQIQVRKLADSGVLATGTYSFTTALKSGSETEMKGWCLGSTPLTEGQFVLQPGEAFLINNKRTDEVITLGFPQPVK